MKPRYAIVRVDKEHYLNSCPAVFEEINNDFVCSYNKDTILYQKDKTLNQYVCDCSKCRYGDTKEQLIQKVKQAIERIIQQRYIEINYSNFKMSYTTKSLAKDIVEFLGVEK